MSGMQGKCDVCGKETEVFVAASIMGPISLAYCRECIQKGLEPYHIMVAYISCAGRFPDDINEAYVEEVRHILKGLNKSEEEFINDVDQSIKEMDEYYSNMSEESFEEIDGELK